MGKIVEIIGNSGVGKTTLVRSLCRLAEKQGTPFATGLEQHAERPFQALMAADLRRYALANQVDYLLLRAEQERALREGPYIGLIDGGLDLDFYGFSRLFQQRGYLDDAEYALCERLYRTLRELLGPPDLYLYLTAPVEVIEQRYIKRGRALEIARREDLALMDGYVRQWMADEQATPIITIDALAFDAYTPHDVEQLLSQMMAVLRGATDPA